MLTAALLCALRAFEETAINYYPFHIGDYIAHTAHLDPIEDCAYRRLLDAYYLNEGPLPADAADVARKIRMKANAADVERVLNEFFTLTDAGWLHARCNNEISKMKEKQLKAKASAEASVRARQAKAGASAEEKSSDPEANDERPFNERSTNDELPTPTPTPTPVNTPSGEGVKRKRSATTEASRPDDVDPKVWTDFIAQRKAKRAPLTDTALEGIAEEAKKAGISLNDAIAYCCSAGWQGFKANWYANREGSNVQATGKRMPRPENFSDRDYGSGVEGV